MGYFYGILQVRLGRNPSICPSRSGLLRSLRSLATTPPAEGQIRRTVSPPAAAQLRSQIRPPHVPDQPRHSSFQPRPDMTPHPSPGRLGPRVAEPQAEPRKLHSFSKSESLSFSNVQVTSSIVFDAPVDDVALPVEP